MLEHLAIRAQLEGTTVLRVQGSLHRTAFSAARHLVDTGLATIADVAQGRRRRSWLTQLFEGDENEKKSVQTPAIAAERFMRIAAMLEASLLDLSRSSPLVVLVDDAEMIDGESLAVLASLAQAIPSHRILLVFAACAGESWQQLPAHTKLLAEAQRYTLNPLSEQNIRELVHTIFGDVPNSERFASWLCAETGGNPGRCVNLARLLISQRVIRYELGTFTLPYEFQTFAAGSRPDPSLAVVLTEMTSSVRHVAHVLAVHSGALPTEHLIAATEYAPRDVLLAIQELLRRGVVVSDGAAFSCANESIRHALASSLPVEQARALHLSLARQLDKREGHVLENRLAVVRHLLAAGGAEALEGACLLARTDDEHQIELGTTLSAGPVLVQALDVTQMHGFPDEECVGLLVPLCLSGFHGEFEIQRRYFDRTMRVLSSICGFGFVKKLSSWFGFRFALFCGVALAFARHRFRRLTLNRLSFRIHMQAFGALPNNACACYGTVCDSVEAYRAAAWLDVFEGAPAQSTPAVLRDFCLATADLAAGKIASALVRYARVSELLEQPMLGLDPGPREQLRYGCLLGKAQALVSNGDPRAMDAASELVRTPFFAPHAETVRTIHHLYRGEAGEAATCRARAETLAFRGGVSWALMGMLSVRVILAAVMTDDVLSLIRGLADLEHLASLSAGLAAAYELSLAHLDQPPNLRRPARLPCPRARGDGRSCGRQGGVSRAHRGSCRDWAR